MRATAAALFLALAAPAALAQAPVSADDAAVRAMETRQKDAILAGDLAELERLWDASYVVNNPQNGVSQRADTLTRVKDGLISYTAYELQIDRITFSGDLAIMMGAETVTPKRGPMAGKTVRRRYTDIWRRRGSGWNAIARQATILNPPPAS